MTEYDKLRESLPQAPKTWLVTGGAGFIGSHLVEALLRLGQRVVVLDNFATGHRTNIEHVLATFPSDVAERLTVLEGDIRDPVACRAACRDASLVLHQAALGSVPRSIHDPVMSNDVNVGGFLQVALAARDAGIRRFVYASSSSVYGDHPGLPKVESKIGRPLSPYAVTKYVDELYASVAARTYGMEPVGLRYFNVFGPRQDPSGPYAAVMPLWFSSLARGEAPIVNGDGETSRDFCFVENVVQANLLAATSTSPEAVGAVFNIACGEQITLNSLFRLIRREVARSKPGAAALEPIYKPFRPGDVRHSLADIGLAKQVLGYSPTHLVADGIPLSADWYARQSRPGGY